ncbi:MAG: hypothetical protein K0S68_538 [Candidatus Saccharibacteria bacterium]|nr:hypothetical protein [Candidatus Saccharibacteria bacterium]
MAANSIDEYLADLAPARREALERVRRIVKATVPEAEESISYGIPTFSYRGKHLIYCANNKNHMSIHGSMGSLEHKLEGFKLSHKGTLQFTEDHQVPEDIIKEIVRIRREALDSDR